MSLFAPASCSRSAEGEDGVLPWQNDINRILCFLSRLHIGLAGWLLRTMSMYVCLMMYYKYKGGVDSGLTSHRR